MASPELQHIVHGFKSHSKPDIDLNRPFSRVHLLAIFTWFLGAQ